MMRCRTIQAVLVVALLALASGAVRAGEPAAPPPGPAAASAAPADAGSAKAAEPPHGGVAVARATWRTIVAAVLRFLAWGGKNAFPITLGLIVILAVVSAIVVRRVNDRCLKSLKRYTVVVQLKDGKKQRGRMLLRSTGFELLYASRDSADSDLEREEEPGVADVPRSFVFYQPEYGKIYAIIHYLDEIGRRERARRDRYVRGVFNPSLRRRLLRDVRNILVSVRDTLLELMTAAIGRFKSIGPQAAFFATQEKYISRLGTNMLTVATDYAYDPTLECLIGHRVLVEVGNPDGTVRTLCGVLKEYSKDFMEFIDMEYPTEIRLTVTSDQGAAATEEASVSWTGASGLKVSNRARSPIEVRTLACTIIPPAAQEPRDSDDVDERCEKELLEERTGPGRWSDREGEELGQYVETTTPKVLCEVGQTESVPLPAAIIASITLTLHVKRRADVMIPRATSVIRHRV